MTRREAAKIIGTATAGLMLPIDASRGQAKGESSAMLTRTIPSSGETLPVIGLGTWRAFDVDLSAELADLISRNLGEVNRTYCYAKAPREIFKAILSRKENVGRVLRMMHRVDFLGPRNEPSDLPRASLDDSTLAGQAEFDALQRVLDGLSLPP